VCPCSAQSSDPLESEKQFDAVFKAHDLWAWNASEVLDSGHFYPGEVLSVTYLDPKYRFHIVWKATDSEIYCIHDSVLNYQTEIPSSCLCHPKFDLVNWYIKQLLRSYHGVKQLMFPTGKYDDLDASLLY
jgi:hypothetical protein